MIIKVASVTDAASILALQYQAYQSEAVLYDTPTIPPLTQSLEQLQGDFDDHVILRASVDRQIVGSVRARVQQATGFIGRLIVHPDHQNRGIGTRLLLAIEQACPTAVRFELFTGHKSVRNLYLYHKVGYREFRREQVSPKLTLVFLEKAVISGIGHQSRLFEA